MRQLFYNVPASDPLSQSLDGFVHVFETVKDAVGVAVCASLGLDAQMELTSLFSGARVQAMP